LAAGLAWNADPIHIRYGSVPDALVDPRGQGVDYEAKPGQFLLWLDGIARYLVSEGKEIVIEPAPDSCEDEIRLFLLGSVLGALLHQRGRLVLHGSAIETKRGAVVFVGPQGAGKSTLAATFRARGFRVLADDACTIDFASQCPQVYPGLVHIKLWADAAEKLAYDARQARVVRPMIGKYAFTLDDEFDLGPVQLHAVYELAPGDTQCLELKPLKGEEMFRVLLRNTYRKHLLKDLGVQGHHFKQVTTIARHVKVQRIARPQTVFLLNELADVIQEDF